MDFVKQSVIVDGHAQDLEQPEVPFTAGQLVTIQQTIQQSIAEAIYNHCSQVSELKHWRMQQEIRSTSRLGTRHHLYPPELTLMF